ncbi:hypothetical protein DFA_10467 [Cavenderia fasciculata]|uniref:Acyltransferase 3 domain-containing protein n=1 Tax=Cavenderia fasciculata TaxID=261658 RepID=F4QAA6_CACFS|nr:uncharacterized protein DFA_10467 [Cavenderia fasciculata]EGG15625.1 hypothetical protein DFA_10467 [Cavenderia fasciculata]|eukprot:XP_004354367.1 hypothetical protein DFA_10467 [Cavenderia fasciculata]
MEAKYGVRKYLQEMKTNHFFVTFIVVLVTCLSSLIDIGVVVEGHRIQQVSNHYRATPNLYHINQLLDYQSSSSSPSSSLTSLSSPSFGIFALLNKNSSSSSSSSHTSPPAQYVNIKPLLEQQLESSSSDVISGQCQSDLYDLSKLKYPDSFQIIEASGKSFFDLGNYDNCLSLPSNVSQYCSVSVGMVTGMGGLCVPVSCSEQDINLALQTAVNLTGMASKLGPMGYQGQFTIHCYSGDHTTIRPPLTTGPIIMIIVCSIIIALVIAGTLIEYIVFKIKDEKKDNNNNVFTSPNGAIDGIFQFDEKKQIQDSSNEWIKESSLGLQILMSFSLIQNYHNFTTSSSEKKHFNVLDGVRFMSTCWVVMGHTIAFNSQLGYDNFAYVMNSVLPTAAFQIITAGEFSVDVFFMLSGFLVGHALLQQLDKPEYAEEESCCGKLLFWMKYLLHRFIRLSPLYYFVLFVFWQLSPQFGSGPFFFGYDAITKSCDANWWTNLLYINTLYPPTMLTECFGWSWYLGDDMLYYIFVAPVAIILYKRSQKLGILYIIFLLALNFITNFWITLKYDLGTFFEFGIQSIIDATFITDIYQKPWTRVGAYAVGLVMAMIVEHQGMLRVIKTHLSVRLVYYTIAAALTSFFTFISYNSYTHPGGWSTMSNAFFNACGHTGFVIGAALFLLTAFAGHGGLVAWIFERPIFKNLSKLTYSTYLIHPIVIWCMAYSRVTPFHYSNSNVAAYIISSLVFSFFCAFIVHLFVEKPCVNLEKLFFLHRRPQQQQQKYTLLN